MHLPQVAYVLESWLSFGFGRLEANRHPLMVADKAGDSRGGRAARYDEMWLQPGRVVGPARYTNGESIPGLRVDGTERRRDMGQALALGCILCEMLVPNRRGYWSRIRVPVTVGAASSAPRNPADSDDQTLPRFPGDYP